MWLEKGVPHANLQQVLYDADAIPNPLESGLEAFTSLTFHVSKLDNATKDETKVPTTAKIEHHRAPLPKRLHKACMLNMSDHYKASQWGLDLPSKAKELKHKKARFLIATLDDGTVSKSPPPTDSTTPEILAFAHFRYDFDDDEQPSYAVLYVYELQVHPSYQKFGIGRRFMSIMELIAMKSSMTYVMLTVFKHNEIALKFYLDKMKYSIADHSPSNFIEEGEEMADYEILWKCVSKQSHKLQKG